MFSGKRLQEANCEDFGQFSVLGIFCLSHRGLSALVELELGHNPFSGELFPMNWSLLPEEALSWYHSDVFLRSVIAVVYFSLLLDSKPLQRMPSASTNANYTSLKRFRLKLNQNFSQYLSGIFRVSSDKLGLGILNTRRCFICACSKG